MAESRKPIVIPKMGWSEIGLKLMELGSSKALDVELRSAMKVWGPIIDGAEAIVKKFESIYQELAEIELEQKEQQPASNEITEFLAVLKEIIEIGKTLTQIDFDLYFVDDKQAAAAIKSESAVILYQEQIEVEVEKRTVGSVLSLSKPKKRKKTRMQQYVRVVNKKSNIDETQPVNHLIEKDRKITLHPSGEVVLTEKTVKYIDETARPRAKEAGIQESDLKHLVDLFPGILMIIERLPRLFAASRKLPFSHDMSKHLYKLEKEADKLDLSKIVEKIVPTGTYKKIKQKAFDALEPSAFSKLSPDAQAGALALAEVYYEALKLLILKLDNVEINLRLKPGSLAKIPVIGGQLTKQADGQAVEQVQSQSIQQLYDEFYPLYVQAMKTAGYQPILEQHRFKDSLLKQRVAMLKALPPAKRASKKAERIRKKIQELGGELPVFKQEKEEKNDEIEKGVEQGDAQQEIAEEAAGQVKKEEEDKEISEAQRFYQFLENTLQNGYAEVQKLRERFPVKEAEEKKEEEEEEREYLEKTTKFIDEARKKLQDALDSEVFNKCFVSDTVAEEELKEASKVVEEERKADPLADGGDGGLQPEKKEEKEEHWIEQAGRAFVRLEKIIEKINGLKAEPKVEKKFETPFERLTFRTEQVLPR